jgi:hypothetical protein
MKYLLHTVNGGQFVCEQDAMDEMIASRPSNHILWIAVTELNSIRRHSLRVDKVVSYEILTQ